MNASVTLILIVAGSYLAAHVAFGWLAQRYLIVSGAEYLLLGILLGPQVSRLISASVFDGFAPFMTLSLGWIGALVGAQFYVPDLVRLPVRRYRIAFTEAILTGGIVSGLMALSLSWAFGLPLQQVIAPAIILGSISAVSSPAGIGIVARRVGQRRPVVQQLQLSTAIDAVVAITAFSLVLIIYHAPPTGVARPPTATEWAVISIAIGTVGGTLFHLFLGNEKKIDRLFIGLAGAIMLASGSAAYLRLSPLFPTMLIGAILINTSSNRLEIRKALSALERPIYFLLLIFAGAAWRSAEGWLIPVVVFIIARTISKVSSAQAAGWFNDSSEILGRKWGYALLGQGGLAVAMALNYLLYDRSALANVIFTTTLVSVLLTDIVSARFAERVVRANETSRGKQDSGRSAARSSELTQD